MPPRFFHLDPSTLVLDTVPSSEDRQKRLIRLTIESADRLAIMTSFSVNPAKDHVPGQVSGTTFAMLESLAKRQHDADFTFILLYNDNKLQRNALVAAVVGQNVTANMSLKTESRLPGTTTWPEVVRAYNRQQTDEHLRLGNVRCRIYFVSAKARGAAGSHHNKFAINDRGIAATLGASIANKTKDGWLDGGCIAIGSGLARSQRDYFVDELIGNHAISCGRLLCNGDEAAMQPLARPADTFKALKQVQIRSPFGSDSRVADQERMLDAFDNTGIAFRGGKHKVLWMQNPSNGYRNMFSTGGRIEGKPIGFALAKIFGSAGSGDRLDIAGKKLGTEAFALIGKALARGCDVNILVDVSSRKIADLAATQLYRRTTNPPVGTLTIKHYAPEPQWAQTLRINMDSELVLHAKNYLLTRADGTCVVMTGSYNLDGQSHYRSNENLMVFETRDDRLCRALFEDIRQGSNSKESIYRKR
ncbi:PLD-like domain-containing protein [Paracidovorax konjaci]|uniref:PLD-like domain-containing protein n=2 Tax=Paracidovorax konjaci TaxID=32040 RepID=A0A1I1WWL9_9BURK|nr:PLD-like domain-containing protein [Paracidovorax konjaci]